MITIRGLNDLGEVQVSYQVPAALEAATIAKIEAAGLMPWVVM